MAKLLIFDWDGTLSNSLDRIAHAMRWAADDAGMRVPEVKEVHEIVGLGLNEAVAKLFPGIGIDEIQALRERYSKEYFRIDEQTADFYPGVMETLQALKADGYLLAVATGKSRRGLNRVLESKCVADFFDDSRCADETASKPDPLMLNELIARFGLQPDEAIMVGDTEYDMAMAQAAAMPRIGVSYGAHAAQRLHNYDPLGCVDHFPQVAELVAEYSASLR